MHPSIRRPFGTRPVVTSLAVVSLLLICRIDAVAQQHLDANILQTPQVFRFAAPSTTIVPSAPQIDPGALIRIPVTVIDDAGRCVESLSERDFSLSVDGEESAIALFRPSHATSAALGVLVDVSQGMSFKSWHGGTISKVPFVQWALATIIDKLDYRDNVFVAAFARRFQIIDDFTTDHEHLKERLPMLRPPKQGDDSNGDGIYESMLEGIAKLAHAPKNSDRRVLLVFTNDFYDTSIHGVEDVIARAQFGGVTVYNIIVQGFSHETDMLPIRDGIGRIASETGGVTFVINGRADGDRIYPATDEIASELDNQYVLGFSVSPWKPGALPIELMLRHHTGMRAYAPRVVRFRPEDLLHQLDGQPAQILPE